MRSRYLQAIFFQALAPVSFLLFSFFVTKQAGVSSQGAFASAKSWVDVLIVVGCFGFPQSSILAINKDGASAKWLYKATSIYVAVLFPLFALGSIVLQDRLVINPIAAICIGLGAAASVLTNVWRGILLTIDDGIRFHLITILPTFTLIVSSSIGLAIGYDIEKHVSYFYGATAFMLMPVAYYLFPWRTVAKTEGKKPSLKRLLTNGSDVFMQALSGALQTYICLWFLRNYYDMTQVGYFSLSLLLVNAIGFPLQAISPMILNRWSKSSGRESLSAGGKELKLLLIFISMAIVCILIFLNLFSLEIYLGEIGKLLAPMSIAIFILIPNISLRVDSLRLTSVGYLRFNSIIAILKCMIFTLTILVMGNSIHSKDGAKIAMICWLLAEFFAALCSRLRVIKAQTEFK